jgi:hypothetical protein
MRIRVAVRQADLDDGALDAPPQCIEAFADAATVTVVLEHLFQGDSKTRLSFDSTLDEGRFTGLEWPPDLRPGAFVMVSWQAGRDEVVMRTVVLDEPMRIDGVDYFHEYDPIVVTHEFTPGESNRDQVLATVRRQGRVFEDGTAVFPSDELAARSGLGRGKKGTFLLRNAVEQLIREGYVTRVEGSTGDDGELSYPAVDGEEPTELLFYAPLIEPTPLPSEGERHEHWVNGFVRKLPPGAQPSPKQLSLHQRAIENEDVNEQQLAPGYTFVRRHHRHG